MSLYQLPCVYVACANVMIFIAGPPLTDYGTHAHTHLPAIQSFSEVSVFLASGK